MEKQFSQEVITEVEENFNYFKQWEIDNNNITPTNAVVFIAVENYVAGRCADMLFDGIENRAKFFAACKRYAHQKFMEELTSR
ncbi:MAG: hypothetical protein M0R03_22895 [Novosphingobium sp.]|nr:hypothetical protein [Novosphingobium sp.]